MDFNVVFGRYARLGCALMLIKPVVITKTNCAEQHFRFLNRSSSQIELWKVIFKNPILRGLLGHEPGADRGGQGLNEIAMQPGYSGDDIRGKEACAGEIVLVEFRDGVVLHRIGNESDLLIGIERELGPPLAQLPGLAA